MHPPPTQYATEDNLAARQRLWAISRYEPAFSLYPWVLGVAGLRGGEAVLEVGCGEGRVTRDLIARGHHVVAVDITEALLRTAYESDDQGGYVRCDAAPRQMQVSARSIPDRIKLFPKIPRRRVTWCLLHTTSGDAR